MTTLTDGIVTLRPHAGADVARLVGTHSESRSGSG